jgi:hypothetical protein
LFSQKDFIDASRDYVCVRLESYESKEHQDMVREFLNGRFENTAFCLLAPDGKERLSSTGRSPKQGLGGGPGRRNGGGRDDAVIATMKTVAKKYPTKGEESEAVVQDFHTFRQALNVASGDQRLLVFVEASEKAQEELQSSLRPVFADEEVIGRYHVDFSDREADAKWADAVSGVSEASGLFIIQSDQFGLKGKALDRLPLDAKPEAIKAALKKANVVFSKSDERKVYSDHVAEGRREGVHFENGMPYGEDRDADGKIDERRGGGRRRSK